MSAGRRVELLSWAARAGHGLSKMNTTRNIAIPGSRLRHCTVSIDLDRSFNVGTFTKDALQRSSHWVIVVPERLVEAFRIARSFIDRHAPTLDQAVLTEFINEGHFGHHVRKMRSLLGSFAATYRRSNRRLSGLLDVQHAQSGMRTVAWIKNACPRNGVDTTRRTAGIGSSSNLLICQQVRAEARVDAGLRRV